ncbi:hypothetical protein N7493_004017 [Penicillium malachiteum]|uniref:Uncharacterized protein n=1 Tax=Penicillium malachiteum TaxID=1324776 RepID=A0AAD6HRD6_9EURO|nr:hypothetical protein N7493_004017 [Penicillium malachiteum]
MPSNTLYKGKTSSPHATNSDDAQRVHIAAEMSLLRNHCENLKKLYDSNVTTQEGCTEFHDQTFFRFDEHLDELDYTIQKAMESFEQRLAEAGNSKSVNSKTDPANCPGPCLSGRDSCFYKRLGSLEAKITEKDMEICRLKMKARYSSTLRYQCIHLPPNHCESARYIKLPLRISDDASICNGFRLTDLEGKVSELYGLTQRVKDLEHEIGHLGDNRFDEKKEPDGQTKVSWVEVVQNQKAKKVKCRLRRWLHI